MKILFVALLCLLSPSYAFCSSGESHSAQEHEWPQLQSAFGKAFDRGDVEELERLKTDWADKGFANIDDLGGRFMKYGSTMKNWDKLIADAKENQK
ncbi:MAG: hypothetical protein C0514_01130 [Candidatus Puniceispirillum sp.]|nr:hypothetical protein [Candidatus Puniceispirillum sp.]